MVNSRDEVITRGGRGRFAVTGTAAVWATWGTLFAKGIAVRFGRTHDRRYTRLLHDMVTSGRA
jgi:hypothetical protein